MTDHEANYEMYRQKRIQDFVVPVPEKKDWPNLTNVERSYPDLCAEEHIWILEGLVSEACRLREERG